MERDGTPKRQPRRFIVKLSKHNPRVRMAIRALLGALLLTFFGCSDGELGELRSIDGCRDLRFAFRAGDLHADTRYRGKSGFVFESLAGVEPAEADIETCERLERS